MATGSEQRPDVGPTVSGSDRDHDGEERDLAASLRDEAGDRRDVAGAVRDADGDVRDATGERRDLAADERDRAAEARDRAAPLRGPRAGVHPIEVARAHAASDRSHAARDRLAGARDRSTAEDDRTTSLADREAGEAERAGSERDRTDGSADRMAAAGDRSAAALDPLTGARDRRSGLAEVAREVQRAERTSQPLAVVYVDVDGLKSVNDSRGHAAGDRALVAVVEAIRGAMRSYDLVVRMGGDEFLCVFAGLEESGAHTRVATVTAALEAASEPVSATFGVAQMIAGESPEELIARADAELYARRAQRRTERGRT